MPILQKRNREQQIYRLLLFLSFLAFISLGLPDGLLGVAWPSISGYLGVPLSKLAVLQIAMTAGFFLSSTNAGRLMRSLGVGRLLIFSNILVATALSLYVWSPHWYVLVGASVLLGSGGGAVDAGLNAYSAEHFTKEQVTLLHAFFGFGAMIGPFVMREVLQRGRPWQRGYAYTLLLVLVLLLIFTLFRRLWYQAPKKSEPASEPTSEPTSEPASGPASQAAVEAEDAQAAQNSETASSGGQTVPKTVARGKKYVGIAMFLFYTAVEVTIGAWSFSLLTEGRGIDAGIAALWIGGYWAALTGGRLFFGFLGQRWQSTGIIIAMSYSLVIGALMLMQPWWSALFLIALPIMGFSCAPLFPLFITLTPHVVGPSESSRLIGLQVASASVGAAVIPAVVGGLVELYSLEAVSAVVLALAIFVGGLFRHWSAEIRS